MPEPTPVDDLELRRRAAVARGSALCLGVIAILMAVSRIAVHEPLRVQASFIAAAGVFWVAYALLRRPDRRAGIHVLIAVTLLFPPALMFARGQQGQGPYAFALAPLLAGLLLAPRAAAGVCALSFLAAGVCWTMFGRLPETRPIGPGLTLLNALLLCLWVTVVAIFSSRATAQALAEARRREQEARESARVQQALEERVHHAQKVDAMGRMVGTVAHDFNNLLAVIQGSADALAHELGHDPRAREDLDALQTASAQAVTLVRQLLVLARRERTAEARPVELTAALRDSRALLARLLGDGVELRMEVPDDLGRVVCDPGQLEQVLLNLTANARDAMPDGGRLVVSGVRNGRGEAVLEVRDTGKGIAPEVRERLFEPFFTTKPEGKGTGLGLATCWRIVEQLGGRIDVESTPGHGATFRVHLPLQDAARAVS